MITSRVNCFQTVTYIQRKKKSDNKVKKATAISNYGKWTLLKGSIFDVVEDVGVSQKAKSLRINMSIDSTGKLFKYAELEECATSFDSSIIMNQSNNGLDRLER